MAFCHRVLTVLKRSDERFAHVGRALIAELETTLADPGFYGRDPARFAEANRRAEAARAELPGLEEKWLELEMLREAGP